MNVLDRLRLDGKRALVTGGSRGLGRAIALALAEAGADLVLVGRTPESLANTAAEIAARGKQALSLVADVSLPDECRRVCQQALESGPIDILVNNAGGRRVSIPLEKMPLETWKQLIDLNLTSAVLCTQILGPPMLERRWGRIINIASINSFVVGRKIHGRHYETAKAALVQFTRAVAADWAPFGVTVNAICPGGFWTEANERWAREHPEVIETFRQQIPMGELGQPEDLGPLAVYLASDASRYMTGAALVIDGGYTLW
ncbi:MAG: 2-deoxy-D-gluconate 3-dehydrogenase [Pirellulaceae bacterium]|nr:MAG: 2-deoxy-D-gluconate 3-dehydrogenase [Pirellulaceae bacterium]